MKKAIIILIALIFIGCSKDPYGDYDITNKESANAIFKPYFDQFRKEAEKRGFDFTNHEIEFYLADIDGKPAGALTNYSKNEIIVDRDNWFGIHETRKEQLAMHELGHSILKRKHKEMQTENGECLSYMRSSPIGCKQNSYSNLWREYYFDELFDKSTTLPDWYTNNQSYNFTYENKNLLVQELDNENRTYQMDIDVDTISNFVLEVTFKNWQSTSENSPYKNTKINVNGINYESNPNRNAIYIYNNDYSKRYFSKYDYNYEDDLKLTIRRNDGVYSFYIDENFVHVTSIDSLETESLNVDFSSGISKDIVLFEFD